MKCGPNNDPVFHDKICTSTNQRVPSPRLLSDSRRLTPASSPHTMTTPRHVTAFFCALLEPEPTQQNLSANRPPWASHLVCLPPSRVYMTYAPIPTQLFLRVDASLELLPRRSASDPIKSIKPIQSPLRMPPYRSGSWTSTQVSFPPYSPTQTA